MNGDDAAAVSLRWARCAACGGVHLLDVLVTVVFSGVGIHLVQSEALWLWLWLRGVAGRQPRERHLRIPFSFVFNPGYAGAAAVCDQYSRDGSSCLLQGNQIVRREGDRVGENHDKSQQRGSRRRAGLEELESSQGNRSAGG
ncbi:hypothetical protein JX266_014242 [Neoarthrinium moseri]|nr:hypothetical protein JX266_014242 [Neoarthrinium moseri]